MVVTPGYLEALEIRLMKGRLFSDSDQESTQPVVIINQSMERRYWPGRESLGEQISVGPPNNAWLTVVGVIEDIKTRSLTINPRPEIYIPRAQLAYSKSLGPNRAMTLVARTESEPMDAVATLKTIVRSVDRDLPLASI
jgi:putative ABC transport system permease protein